MRHDVALPGPGRAPGGAQGGAAQGRALLRHVVLAGHGLVPRAFPDAAPGGQDRAAVRLAGADLRIGAVLHVPPPGRRPDRPGSARRQADRAGPQPGRAGLLAARPRAGARVRARARFRQRDRPGAGPAAPRGGEAHPRPGVLQLRPPAPRLPGPRRVRALPERDGPARRPGTDPRGGERAVLQRSGGHLRRGARVPGPAHAPGPAAVRPAQRPAAPGRHGPGPARRS